MGNKSLKFFETNEFKKLQDVWYGALKDNGFKDREDLDNSFVAPFNETRYSFRHHIKDHKFIHETIDAKLNYYLLIGQQTLQEEFKNPRDELIMSLVADGFGNKDIGLRIKEHGYKCHRKTIMFVIRRFEKKWGIRDWQMNQLTSNRVTSS